MTDIFIHIGEMLARNGRLYPDERLGEIVAVIIDLIPGLSLTEEELAAYCAKLPRYKRPRKVFFGQVPRSPTGKIEKPKLRKKYCGREETIKG